MASMENGCPPPPNPNIIHDELPRLSKSICRNSGSTRLNRYKKFLCTVDLTKDFFFSYSYHVMRSLQKNLCNKETGHVLYETMFVWNEFLTRGIRNHLQNTLWTVALVYGFFKQATFSISGRDFKLTLIARRSRHYAGTRYLKRGVNEKGRVANDVETEQIVFEDVPEGFPIQISSVVQNRGSIPLFWSQETSRLNLKPDIILSRKDKNYEATRLHFENLVKRYGNPIIILNLIKTQEKKPRESILRAEFANAIDYINKDLSEENRLRFLHWDLHKHTRSKATNVLLLLGKMAAYALTWTSFFYCQNTENGHLSPQNTCSNDGDEDANDVERPFSGGNGFSNGNHSIKPPMFQQGFIDTPKIDLGAPLADELMGFYERMGDTLAHQYGGSAAHNKIFSQRRGHWKAAIQSQEFFRTLQRYYSNAYMDAEKQDAINVWNILHESRSPMSPKNVKEEKISGSALPNQWEGESNVLSESSPDISTCESDIAFSRSSLLTSSPIAGMSSENVVNGIMSETTPSTSEYGSSMKVRQETEMELSYGNSQNSDVLEEFSDSFVQWVNCGETLCH
ncbi:hypothetical protein GH714_037994 [Hevea brasiliensis]|uniref:SAC domain-containing protein n=1 Tax=Hevea brasiliensis TaxID=3981 RepID=A0A6A6KAJ2_HEVBR|nr:hypothetical protein GH714_037994 [Hevea brasiliensis]